MSELEREFGNFVEDEREREGRLFRRWCTLTVLYEETLPDTSTGAYVGTLTPNDGSARTPPLGAIYSTKISPRSIIAFVRHFAINVVAAKYNAPVERHEALLALTESLVYRRTNPVVFRYPSLRMQELDSIWRSKCTQCQYVDPVSYGVPIEYLRGQGGNIAEHSGNTGMGSTNGGSGGTDMGAMGNTGIDGGDLDTTSPQDLISPHRSASSSTIDLNQLEGREYEDSLQSRSSGGGVPVGILESSPSKGPGPAMNWTDGEDYSFLSVHRRLERVSIYPIGTYGALYARSSRVLSLLSSSITPREITHHLLLSIKWLLRDAVAVSGVKDYLGADLLFPILVLTLVHAQIPSMHLILHFLHKFGEYDTQGEAAYYVTCLEAATAFILRMQGGSAEGASHALSESEKDATSLAELRQATSVNEGAVDKSVDESLDFEESDRLALMQLEREESLEGREDCDVDKLSDWLRDQHTMEETIEILENEGWMV